MNIAILSDTHGSLPPEVFPRLEGVDQIVHAGDIGPLDILRDLEAVAPVTAVWGNTDGFNLRSEVPEVAHRLWEGQAVVVLHGHQVGTPTPEAMAELHPDADLVIFGHTHEPVTRRVGSVLAVNPGSLGAPPADLGATLVVAHLDGSGIRTRLVELGNG